jgi:hypothetical protein
LLEAQAVLELRAAQAAPGRRERTALAVRLALAVMKYSNLQMFQQQSVALDQTGLLAVRAAMVVMADPEAMAALEAHRSVLPVLPPGQSLLLTTVRERLPVVVVVLSDREEREGLTVRVVRAEMEGEVVVGVVAITTTTSHLQCPALAAMAELGKALADRLVAELPAAHRDLAVLVAPEGHSILRGLLAGIRPNPALAVVLPEARQAVVRMGIPGTVARMATRVRRGIPSPATRTSCG